MKLWQTVVIAGMLLCVTGCSNQLSESAAQNEPTWYAVHRVIDGDTFQVSADNKIETVRLVGIDTPESVDPRRPVECYGREASVALTSLIAGKEVRLEIDSTQSDRDRYGRWLRFAFLRDERDIGLTLLEQGYAQEALYSTVPHRYHGSYVAAEARAAQDQRGLWSEAVCEVASPSSSPLGSPNLEWQCDCSKPCAKLTCAEAQFQLSSCNCQDRDGDQDGVACNAQCR